MQIESYEFGKAVVAGKKYTSDFLIAGGKIYEWWRKEGHLLQPEDLDKIWQHSPAILIIGTGASGVMKVTGDTAKMCREKKVDLRVFKTQAAVKEYNRVSENKKTACGLHLTC